MASAHTHPHLRRKALGAPRVPCVQPSLCCFLGELGQDSLCPLGSPPPAKEAPTPVWYTVRHLPCTCLSLSADPSLKRCQPQTHTPHPTPCAGAPPPVGPARAPAPVTSDSPPFQLWNQPEHLLLSQQLGFHSLLSASLLRGEMGGGEGSRWLC